MADLPDRVLVYGVTGSGKSTAALAIGARTGHPVTLVDELTWLPGWVPVDGAVQRDLISEVVAGERWLLRPELRSHDGRLWSPGIRIGVRPGSWFARTECFFRMPAIFDVGEYAIPTNNLPVSSTQWHAATVHPAIHAISSPPT